MVDTRSQRRADNAEQDDGMASPRPLPNLEAEETERSVVERREDTEQEYPREQESPARDISPPYCLQIHVEYLGTYGAKKGIPVGPPNKHLWEKETILEAFQESFQWMGTPEIVQVLNRREAVMIWDEDRDTIQIPKNATEMVVRQLKRATNFMGRPARVNAFSLPLRAGWLAVDEARRVQDRRQKKTTPSVPQMNNNNTDDETDSESLASSASAEFRESLLRQAAGDGGPRSPPRVNRSGTSYGGSLPPERPVRVLPQAPTPRRRNLDQRSIKTSSSTSTTPSQKYMRKVLRGDALKNPKLPKFGNKEGGVSYESWKGRVRMFQNMPNCQDHVLINEMLDSLRGTAQELASQSLDLEAGVTTVDSILECLDSHLGNVKDILTLRDEVAAIKMTTTESVSAYSLRLDTAMQRLLRSYPDSMSAEYVGQEKKSRFYHGLRTSFKNALSFRYHARDTTFQDMLRYARQHEAETRAAYLNTSRTFTPRKEADPNQYAFKRHPKGTAARSTTVKSAVASMVGDPDPDKEEAGGSVSSSDTEDEVEEDTKEGVDTSPFPQENEGFDEWQCRLAEAYAASNPSWKAEVTCHGCGKKGHFKRECPQNKPRDIKHEKKTSRPSGNARPGAAE